MESKTEQPWDGSGLLALPTKDGAMEKWTDQKRTEFINSLEVRIEDAKIILNGVASAFYDEAYKRHFINRNSQVLSSKITRVGYIESGKFYTNNRSRPSGALSANELSSIIQSRADQLIEELPRSLDIMRIIKPDTAARMDLVAKLKAKKTILEEELATIPKTLNMKDLPQSMTLAEFQKQMAAMVKRRKTLIENLHEIGEEMAEEQDQVNRDLYKGIPELEKAVSETLDNLADQILLYGQMYRRLEEKVKFGDSVTAMSIFAEFKENEVKINSNAKQLLEAAISKIGTKKVKKQLTAKKK